MKLLNTTRAVVAGMAISAAALTLTACGSDEGGSESTTTSSAVAAPCTNNDPALPPIPTPADLNTQLSKALDPATPPEEVASMIQGGGPEDIAVIQELASSARSSNITVEITGVCAPSQPYGPDGPVLNATGNIVVPGQAPGEATVYFVPENGAWKVQKQWACDILANALGKQAPSCTQ
ncbi:hypothetical protein [Antrihabitans sp. YC2-6]|uniref:hypothetical protein n=1 Tax=Antrihabitans sp. YC2-6 TaxID=2799498 RepID=UPI0018F77E07|nr:hypothetical protein [Antrihabitans sp. YC2-6]MBJ8343192.1 hypothetical protein [Antrihabitans sp. YC2-6]